MSGNSRLSAWRPAQSNRARSPPAVRSPLCPSSPFRHCTLRRCSDKRPTEVFGLWCVRRSVIWTADRWIAGLDNWRRRRRDCFGCPRPSPGSRWTVRPQRRGVRWRCVFRPKHRILFVFNYKCMYFELSYSYLALKRNPVFHIRIFLVKELHHGLGFHLRKK